MHRRSAMGADVRPAARMHPRHIATRPYGSRQRYRFLATGLLLVRVV